MTTIYVSSLNASSSLDKASIFKSIVGTSEGVNANDLEGGSCTVNEVATAFKFYTTPLTNGGDGTNYKGAVKTTTNFNNPPLTVGADDMLKLLAESVFGSAESAGLFNNVSTIKTKFDEAADACLTSVNAEVTVAETDGGGAAAEEFVNALLTVMPERFELLYKYTQSGLLDANTIFGDIDDDSNQDTPNTVGMPYQVQTPSGSLEDSGGTVVVESDGTGNVLRITVLTNATRKVLVGDQVIITIAQGTTTSTGQNATATQTITLNGYDKFVGVNSVQVSMFNGTLDAINSAGVRDAALYTAAPVEIGDSVRVKYAIGSAGAQMNANGQPISVGYASYVIFTADSMS
jgi:hypothetical protein